MQIVILDAQTIGRKAELDVFSQFGELRVFDTTLENERLHNIGEAEIIITNKVLIDKYVIDNCPNLKLVCVTATGLNNIDLVYAEKSKIQVKNAKAYSTESVAQHTFSCLLSLNSRLAYYNDYVVSGKYTNEGLFTHLGPEIRSLHGKTFGIIGLGAIGRRVAQLALAFGCKVCYFSTSGLNKAPDYQRLPLQQLLAESDIVSIHAPLNEQTKNLITLSELKQMKPKSILLNMGRGGIVNEADLALALQSEMISAACLDVLESEPLQKDSPLWSVLKDGKLLITPHIAWAGVEARKRLLEITVQNIHHFIG